MPYYCFCKYNIISSKTITIIFRWIDKKNLDELIRPWYCKALPFPFNFYYPGRFERQAQSLMQSLYPMEDNINVIENDVCNYIKISNTEKIC